MSFEEFSIIMWATCTLISAFTTFIAYRMKKDLGYWITLTILCLNLTVSNMEVLYVKDKLEQCEVAEVVE